MTPAIAASATLRSAIEPFTTSIRSVASIRRLWQSARMRAPENRLSASRRAMTLDPTLPVAPVTSTSISVSSPAAFRPAKRRAQS